jgi:hypothetical protein
MSNISHLFINCEFQKSVSGGLFFVYFKSDPLVYIAKGFKNEKNVMIYNLSRGVLQIFLKTV